MAAKKPADLSGLVATKGTATPLVDMPTRAPAPAVAATPAADPGSTPKATPEGQGEPLNFRVSADFRRRFRRYALERDLKLSELLRLAFDDYAARHPLD